MLFNLIIVVSIICRFVDKHNWRLLLFTHQNEKHKETETEPERDAESYRVNICYKTKETWWNGFIAFWLFRAHTKTSLFFDCSYRFSCPIRHLSVVSFFLRSVSRDDRVEYRHFIVYNRTQKQNQTNVIHYNFGHYIIILCIILPSIHQHRMQSNWINIVEWWLLLLSSLARHLAQSVSHLCCHVDNCVIWLDEHCTCSTLISTVATQTRMLASTYSSSIETTWPTFSKSFTICSTCVSLPSIRLPIATRWRWLRIYKSFIAHMRASQRSNWK